MKLALAKILSHQYLVESDYKLMLPEGHRHVTHRTAICKRLYEQFDEGFSVNKIARRICDYADGTNWATVTKMINAGFDPEKLLKGRYLKIYQSNHTTFATERFIIEIRRRDTGKVVGAVETTIADVETCSIIREESPGINVMRVMDKRQAAMDAELAEAVVFNPADHEAIAMSICEDFATGLMGIHEVLAKHGVDFLSWVEWCRMDDNIRRNFEEAIGLANMFNQMRHVTMVDALINNMLTRGKHTETIMTFHHVFVPGKLKPELVEKGPRKVKERDFTPSELIGMRAILGRNLVLNGGNTDQFANMTKEEIEKWLEENNTKLIPNIGGGSVI